MLDLLFTSRLTDKNRSVYIAYRSGYSSQEIADALDITRQAVWQHIDKVEVYLEEMRIQDDQIDCVIEAFDRRAFLL